MDYMGGQGFEEGEFWRERARERERDRERERERDHSEGETGGGDFSLSDRSLSV